MVQTVTRSDIRHRKINGLRLLADALEANPDLPVPQLQVIAGSEEEVERAARTQPNSSVHYNDGHTTAELNFGGIGVHVFHISDERMKRHAAEQSYSTVVQP